MRTTHNAPDQPPDDHRTDDRPPDDHRAGRPRQGEPAADRAAHRAGAGRARRAAEWGRVRYTGSWAENLRYRLNAVELINQAIMLAAMLLLCAVPFMLVASALAGRDAVPTLTRRLGLSDEAATDFGRLFASATATDAAITGMSWVFFVVAGIAVGGSLQQLYQRVFRLPPLGPRDRLRSLVWLAVCVAWIAAGTSVGHAVHGSVPELWWLLNVPAFVGFFWFTMWFLLAGRVGWRRLLPCAVATGVFWVGMVAFFHVFFSGMVISSNDKYGPIGVVLSLMSFFIAIGVVIILGAATGMMWHERGMSLRAAVTGLRRAR